MPRTQKLMVDGNAAALNKTVVHFFEAYAGRAAQFEHQMRIDLGSTVHPPTAPPAPRAIRPSSTLAHDISSVMMV